MTDLEFHPYADLFPLIEGTAFDELVADVSAHGVREPIWLHEGKILDGRNRYRAAMSAGVACPSQDFEGDDPLDFVISLNLKRRHLSESQRAMVAAKLTTLSHGQRKSDTQICVSQPEAATMLNVASRSVQNAAAVRRNGTPELVAAVESGKVAVSAAAVAARHMPAEAQRKATAEGTIAEAAKAVAAHRRAEVKLKQAESIIAAAPVFTPDETARIKEAIGTPEDGDVYSRIGEAVDLIAEQPDPEEACRRIPPTLRSSVDTASIMEAVNWLTAFCSAWAAQNTTTNGKMEAGR